MHHCPWLLVKSNDKLSWFSGNKINLYFSVAIFNHLSNALLKEEGDSGDSSLRLQTYKLQVMVEQLKEVLNEMQILMLNCCEEEPLGRRPRKEDRKKKRGVSFKKINLLS